MLVTESSVIVGLVLAERQWPELTLGKCYLFLISSSVYWEKCLAEGQLQTNGFLF